MMDPFGSYNCAKISKVIVVKSRMGDVLPHAAFFLFSQWLRGLRQEQGVAALGAQTKT